MGVNINAINNRNNRARFYFGTLFMLFTFETFLIKLCCSGTEFSKKSRVLSKFLAKTEFFEIFGNEALNFISSYFKEYKSFSFLQKSLNRVMPIVAMATSSGKWS